MDRDLPEAAAHSVSRQAGLLAALDRVQAVVEFSLDGHIAAANDLFLRSMGYEREEVIGQHHRIFCTAEYATSAAYALLWERLRAGHSDSGVYMRLNKRGQAVWLQASYNPVLDEQGRPVGVVKLATDITAARRQQLDFEAKMAAVSKVMAVIEFDLEGRVLTANENFLQALGYTLEEVQGHHHRLFCDPLYARSLEYRAFWEKLGRGESHAGRFRRVDKTGRDVWIQASYNPVLDVNGKPAKIVKFATDITAETEFAAEMQGKLEAIGRSQAVIEFDLQGNILGANANFLRTMGYTLPEIKGRHHAMFCDSDYVRSQEYRDFWADLAEGKFRAGRFCRAGKHGASVWIQATYNPILGADGQPYKIVKFAVDISAQVRQEQLTRDKIGHITELLQAMTASIDNVVSNTRHATELSQQMQREAGEGSQRSRAAMTELRDSSNAVHEIVDTIGEIAGQTHLLAFNAAIEAARAGEHGMGFSVVADEVRKLAEKAAQAAREIARLIGQNGAKVAEGGRLSDEVDAAFKRIQQQVDKTSEAVSAIHQEMEGQARSTKLVSQLLDELRQQATRT